MDNRWFWTETVEPPEYFEDAWGRESQVRESCFCCYGTGVDYGEACLCCGGLGWYCTPGTEKKEESQ